MKPSFALYRRFLTRYLAHCRGQVALLGSMLLVHTVASVYAPQLLRGFIDGVVAGSPAEQLAAVAALFLAVAAGRQVSRGLTAYFSESVAWSATNRLRSDLLRHTLGLDLSFVNRHAPGVMLERIDGDSNQLATFFSQLSLRLLRGVLLLAGILVALLVEDWRLCLALLGFVAAVTLILVKLRSIGVPYHDRLREAAADLHGFVEERLAGIEDLKALGGLVHALRRMTSLIAVQVRRARVAYSLGTLVWPMVNVVTGIGTGLMLAWGGVLALRGEMTIGTVYLLFSYLNLMFWPFEDLAHQMEELQKAGGSLVRIQRLFDTRGSLRDGTRRTLPPRPAGIAFENVSFRYPDGEAGASRPDRCFGGGPPRALVPHRGGPFLGHPRPHRQREDHGDAAAGAALRPERGARHAERRGSARVPFAGAALRDIRGNPGGAVLPRLHPRQPAPVRPRDRRSPPGGSLRPARSAAVARPPAGRAGYPHQQRATRPVRGRGAAPGPGARVPARSRHRGPGRGGGTARSRSRRARSSTLSRRCFRAAREWWSRTACARWRRSTTS